MHKRPGLCWGVMLLTLGLAAPTSAWAAPPQANDDPVIQAIAATIDRHLQADWSARGIQSAPLAEETEWLRRVHLDLVGRIPRVSEVRDHLKNTDPNKREKLVAQLLASSAHAGHQAHITRLHWFPQANGDFRVSFGVDQFENWLRSQYQANTPVDAMVRKLLTVEKVPGPRGVFRLPEDEERDPAGAQIIGFYQAQEVKPETLAAATTRIFMGVKLECAQCHDHPFAPFTREQFWEFSAFFGEFTPLSPVLPSFVGPLQPQYDRNRVNIPGTDRELEARFLDGSTPTWVSERSPRQELAQWLTSPANPYFAKNHVNRLWAQYFGIGLINPVDEISRENPPSHPALLEELTQAFISHGYNQRALIQGMLQSQAYQRTSQLTHPSQADPHRFARMPVKGLSGLQIYNSLLIATGSTVAMTQTNPSFFDRTPRAAFVNAFPLAARSTETETSILQALLLMNGPEISKETDIAQSSTLAAIADAPFLSVEEQIEALSMAALSRQPTDAERERYASYVERGGPSGDRARALADIFWVMLNSTEFLFNH